MYSRKLRSIIFKTVIFVFFLLFSCEFLLYYFVQWKCDWPVLLSTEQKLHLMLLSDTHLLGNRNGHWLDKWRREWQMHRAFQTAMVLHRPDMVVFLGDVTDEGLWCPESEFQDYVHRFRKLFAVPDGTKLFVVVGNHDIGFHYGISPYLHHRFSTAFDSPPVQMVPLQGNYFVLINSMTMEGDGCGLCTEAEEDIWRIGKKLRKKNSRPIILQHFPLFRKNDAHCSGISSYALSDTFREKWDCLSVESTKYLLQTLRPRAVFSGHTHFNCVTIHSEIEYNLKVPEYTLASFSWRNLLHPTYTLVSLTTNEFQVGTCLLPTETTIIICYCVGFITIIVWLLFNFMNFCKRRYICCL